MARLNSPKDSATSQFFICTDISEEQTAALDGNYAAFGRVIDNESMEVVNAIGDKFTTEKQTHTGNYIGKAQDVPVNAIIISKIDLFLS